MSTSTQTLEAHEHLKGPTAPHLAWKLTAMSCGLSPAACTTLNQTLRSTLSARQRPYVACACPAVLLETSRHARNNKHVHTLGRILTCLLQHSTLCSDLCNHTETTALFRATYRPTIAMQLCLQHSETRGGNGSIGENRSVSSSLQFPELYASRDSQPLHNL